mgnify:CR=1 FL=1
MKQFRICKDCDFSGVYAIVNISKQKIYIGSSRNIKGRLTNHKTKLNHKKNPVAKMQEDYNNGDKFISYVITPVRIREEQYAKDSDLRYFENLAIKEFNATNPETGYNKKDNESAYLRELSNIKYAKRELNHYFSLFSPSCWLGRGTKAEDKKKFINTVLNKQGRF